MLGPYRALKANDGVKNCGEWEQFGVGGKNVCSNVLRSLAKCCIPSRNVAFSLKKNVRSLQRYLHSLAKPVEFGKTLPGYFTACGGSYSSVYSQWIGS